MKMEINVPDGLIRHKDVLYRPVNEDGFEGWIPWTPPTYEAEDKEITMKWNGAKIPIPLWHQICAFFEVQYELTKGEAQVRLFYNAKDRVWKAWAFPQEWSTGMSTKELADHPQRAIQDAQIGTGFKVYGTVHHHCNHGAFQSGTDADNEKAQNGLHITVGGISCNEYSLHGRVYLGRVEYVCYWGIWFDLDPPWMKHVPDSMRESVKGALLKNPPPADTGFPKIWMDNLIKTSYRVGDYSGGHHGANWTPGCSSGNGSPSHQETNVQAKENKEKKVRASTLDPMLSAILSHSVRAGIKSGELLPLLKKLVNNPVYQGVGKDETEFISGVKLAASAHGTTLHLACKMAAATIDIGKKGRKPIVVMEDNMDLMQTIEVAESAETYNLSYARACAILSELKQGFKPTACTSYEKGFVESVQEIAATWGVTVVELATTAWTDLTPEMMGMEAGVGGAYFNRRHMH